MAQDAETRLIQRYLTPLAAPGAAGFRDDAARLLPPPGHELVLTADALVEGTHFLPDDTPADIAMKALTVNRSDLVAKGADPVGYLVTLTFPRPPDGDWMASFATGLADARGLLLGGDMTVGGALLVVSVTAVGTVPEGAMVRRDGARVGDAIFLGGPVGTSGAGLGIATGARSDAGLSKAQALELERFYRAPRLRDADAVTLAVRNHATAAMDVSDGLVLDLRRLCDASGIGARVEADAVPLHPAVERMIDGGAWTRAQAFTAGDDYVVLATAPEEAADALASAGFRRIGRCTHPSEGVRLVDHAGRPMVFEGAGGYDHLT